MTRRRQVSRLLCAIVVVVLACGAGCAAEPEFDSSATGVIKRSGDIWALGMAAVTNDRGVAVVVGTLRNEGEETDTLTGARTDGGKNPIETLLPRGAIRLPPNENVQLSPRKAIMLVSPDLAEGFLVYLTLEFANSPDMTIAMVLKSQTGVYADIEIIEPSDQDVAPPD